MEALEKKCFAWISWILWVRFFSHKGKVNSSKNSRDVIVVKAFDKREKKEANSGQEANETGRKICLWHVWEEKETVFGKW